MKNYLTFTCDRNFLPLAKVLLKSLQLNSPHFYVVARVVNCDSAEIEELYDLYKDLEVINEQKTLSTKRNMLTRDKELYQDNWREGLTPTMIDVNRARWLYSEQIAYCSNIKIDTIYNLLQRDDCKSVLYTDADTIVRGSLEGLQLLVTSNDFSFFLDDPYTDQHQGSKRLADQEVLFQGGLIGVSKNEETLGFVKEWREKILNDIFDWDVDEKTFYSLYKTSLKIGKIPVMYKDEGLSDSSALWSGAGNTKYSNSKYVDEYNSYKC
jgi:hypothetical protein